MNPVSLAVWILAVAVGVGTILALWHLRATELASRPPLAAGIAHGIVGTVGLIVLVWASRGPPRGADAGVASFGVVSAWLFFAAVVTGAATLALRRKPVMMAIHAGIAITGFVLLLAWNSLG